jgi:replication-associated recombination protein RarA
LPASSADAFGSASSDRLSSLLTVALYRKYRPATFAEVVGQEHVTEPLSTALEAGRINHAYLFSGPRGCGKTSSARILARLGFEALATSLYRAAMTGLVDAAREVLQDGRFGDLDRSLTTPELNAFMRP